MFPLDASRVEKVNVALNVENNSKLWRLRFSHLNSESMRSLTSKGMVLGLANIGRMKHCETCAMEKQIRKPFKARRSETAHTRLQLILGV